MAYSLESAGMSTQNPRLDMMDSATTEAVDIWVRQDYDPKIPSEDEWPRNKH